VLAKGVLASAAVAVLLAGSVPRAAHAADDAAAALIAKHAAYVGWHAGDDAMKTLRLSGPVTRENKPRGTIVALRSGIAFRETYITKDGVRRDDGFTGSMLWTSNGNGFTVRTVGPVVRYQFDHEAIFAETTTTSEFVPSFVKNDKVNGHDCAVVRLLSQVGFPLEVCVDPATGAYLRAVIDPGGGYEEELNGLQYTEVQGKRFLSAWYYGKSKVRYVFDKVEPNAQLAEADLRPPKQTATWSFGDAPATIEYNDYHGPRMFVDLVVNGVKGKFILDTGAGGTAMVDSFARRAGGKRFGDESIGGFGGSAKANLFRVDTIAVGGSTLHDVIVTSGLDEETFQREGAVGLIGFDMLAATVADLNLDTKTLRLMDPAKVQPDKTSGLLVQVDLSDLHIRAPMLIDGRYQVMATFDSGSPSNIIFSSDLLKHEKVRFTKVGTGYIYGIGGAEEATCGKLDPVALGPVRYQARWACALESFERNEILVGLDFMRAFNFVFDYPEGLVIMKPRAHY
jgi:hypothetical protein